MCDIPSFIKTENPILTTYLYEEFCNSSRHGLVCTQFLAAFNIFLGVIVSKGAMTEFFYNLSMPPLIKSDDSAFLKSESITELVKSTKIFQV